MLNYCQFQDQPMSYAEDNIIFRGRIFWRDIATWTRAYMVYAYLESDPELQELVASKLMSIPVEFGNMIRIFFGNGIANEYTTLLTNFIALTINLINAQKQGDVDALNDYTVRLYHNADQRAEFLSNMNPFWDKSTLQSLMYNFINMTINESTTFLTKNYAQNINTFDRLLSHSSVIGDYVAQGIMNYLKYSARQPNK